MSSTVVASCLAPVRLSSHAVEKAPLPWVSLLSAPHSRTIRPSRAAPLMRHRRRRSNRPLAVWLNRRRDRGHFGEVGGFPGRGPGSGAAVWRSQHSLEASDSGRQERGAAGFRPAAAVRSPGTHPVRFGAKFRFMATSASGSDRDAGHSTRPAACRRAAPRHPIQGWGRRSSNPIVETTNRGTAIRRLPPGEAGKWSARRACDHAACARRPVLNQADAPCPKWRLPVLAQGNPPGADRAGTDAAAGARSRRR